MKIFYLVLNVVTALTSIIGKVARSTKKAVTRKDVNKEVEELEKLKDDLKKNPYWRE